MDFPISSNLKIFVDCKTSRRGRMVWYLYIVALMFIATGTFFILDSHHAVRLSARFVESGNYRLWGLLAAVFGLLLSVSSFWSGVVWFLFVLGLMTIGMGVFMLVGQEERVDALLRVWGDISERGFRFWGLILLVVGTAILSWI
jgi:hypothetical protein